MRNIWNLFVGDLKRAVSNTVTIIILFGLIVIPSIFSWYNMIASWNVFENTGNLTVAVANTDEGYESDLVPLPVNIGDQVVSALRANTQLNWVFTDEEDAVDGTRSGRYYAAVVIPPSFSRDMMTFYSPEVDHATIRYYSNEKKSAIAPKVTDRGADQISNQVNSVFVETLSEVGLGLSSALLDYADSTDAGGRISGVGDHLQRLSAEMDDAASVLGMYSSTLESAEGLADDSKALLADVSSASHEVADDIAPAKEAAHTISGELVESTASLATAVEKSVEGYASVPDAIDGAFTSAGRLADESSANLRNRASSADALADKLQGFAQELRELRQSVPAAQQASVDVVIARLEAAGTLQGQIASSLSKAADAIDAGKAETAEGRAEIDDMAKQADEQLQAAKADYSQNLEPSLDELATTLQEAGDTLASTTSKLDAASEDAIASADSVGSKLAATRAQLDEAQSSLRQSADELDNLGADIKTAAAQGDSQALRSIIGSDPTAFAAVLSSPVALERHAVYPVENFGSAMSPLYTTLGLWIGALLMMVTLKVFPSRRIVEELDNPTLQELFCGRFGIVAVISLLQSTVVALGNLFLLHVQAEEPLLYMLCFWVAGLVFAFIIYTMVASFGNLGKALGVLLLILQVTGGGGSFPLPLLPQFFQDISPYLPIAHVVNAMRAAMFGVYQGDFWTEMGALLLFTIPFIFLGLVIRNPLVKVVGRFVKKAESSKLM